MLVAARKRWLLWDYEVRGADGGTVGDVRLSMWAAGGTITVDGQVYRVWRAGFLFGPIALIGPAGQVARATRPGALSQAFAIEQGGRVFHLSSPSVWFREMLFREGDETIGNAVPEGVLSRRAQFDLPESLPIEFRLFVVWLALYQWRKLRDSRVSFTGTYEPAPPRM